MNNTAIALFHEAQRALTDLRRVRDRAARQHEVSESLAINDRVKSLKAAIADFNNEYEPPDPMRGVEFPFAENH